MDKTLNPVRKKNKRNQTRNWKAWQVFSPNGTQCRFCPHDHTTHLTSSAQPHFYRLATEEERKNPYEKLYRHHLSEGCSVLVKRVIVAQKPELVTVFCQTCAKEMNTDQVLCFQRTLAMGEVIGLGSE